MGRILEYGLEEARDEVQHTILKTPEDLQTAAAVAAVAVSKHLNMSSYGRHRRTDGPSDDYTPCTCAVKHVVQYLEPQRKV